jgi:hypothetical protein
MISGKALTDTQKRAFLVEVYLNPATWTRSALTLGYRVRVLLKSLAIVIVPSFLYYFIDFCDTHFKILILIRIFITI